MNWISLTILAITSRASYSLGTRLISREIKVSPVTQSVLLTASTGLLGLAISPLLGGINFNGVEKHYYGIILLLLTSVIGNIVYFIGQKQLDAGATQVAFSSILIWGAILSVLFLNSHFSPIQLIGIFLMLFAILLVQYRKSGGLKISSSVLYIIGSAMLFAVFQVASASVSSEVSAATYLTISSLGTALIIFIFYFKKIIKDFKKLILQLKNVFSKTLFTSGTSLCYLTFSYLAYRYAPDKGIVVVLLTSQAVLSVILGIIFLNEKENKVRKLVAGVLTFFAGVLIKS